MLPPHRIHDGMQSAANRRPACADSVKPERASRRLISLPGCADLADRSTISLTVVDLSYEGCKVETPVELFPGSSITLSVAQLGVLGATVRWYRNGKAGLSFNPPVAQAKQRHPRQHERIALKATVSMRRRGSSNYAVTSSEISRSGSRVEFVERPCIGDLHWIKFEGLEALEVRVRWVASFSAGVEFTRPMHPAVFETLIAKLK